MQYDAVLFDFDGVVVETPSRERLSAAVGRTYDALGASGPARETLLALVAGDFDSLAQRCRRLGIDTDVFCTRMGRELVHTQRTAIERGLRSVYDDVTAVRSLHHPLGIVSDNHPTVVSTVLDRFGFRSLFETVHGCPLTPDGLARRKPDPRNITAAMDSLDADDALYVGDRAVDVQAAHNAGIDSALLVRDGGTDELETDATEAKTDATYRLQSLAELPTVVAGSE